MGVSQSKMTFNVTSTPDKGGDLNGKATEKIIDEKIIDEKTKVEILILFVT